MPRSSNVIEGLPAKAQAQIKNIGRSLAAIRRDRGLSQQTVAERMFVSRQTLHRLEAGDPSVSLAVLAAAMFALGLSRRLDELAGHSGSSARPFRTPGARGELDF